MDNQKVLGQYFTKNIELQKIVIRFILNNPDKILEPSVGRGDLIQAVRKEYKNVIFDMFEIDKTIKLLPGIKDINYVDFIEAKIEKKYKTIIGNPPYVKTKKGN